MSGDYYDAQHFERITRPVRHTVTPEMMETLRQEGLKTMDAPSHEDVLAWKAAYYVQNDMNPHHWVTFKGREKKIDGLGTVEVVDVKQDTREREYDEYNMGSTAESHIIFKVTHLDGTVTFLLKEGQYDSLGNRSFEGGMRQVHPKVKTVTVYEL